MPFITVLFAATLLACGGKNAAPDAASAKDAPIAPDARPDAATAVKRVFVTSTQTNGDLKTSGSGTNGFDGGVKLCNAAAARAGLGGTWNVWLSTSAVNAIDVIAGNGPWYLVDGTTLVFTDKASLTSNPMSAIDVDETGTNIGLTAPAVWTGTRPDGTVNVGETCSDWAATSGVSEIGETGNSDSTWTQSLFGFACSTTQVRLYCFEI